MSTHNVLILDAERVPVEAALRDDLTPEQLLEAEKEWGPARLELVRLCKKKGIDPQEWPQHWFWDWTKKVNHLNMLAHNTFGLFVDGKWQGLMMATTAGHQARLDPDKGKPLVYIDFLESAPWNLNKILVQLGEKARFHGIGSRLLEAAICLSLDEGFHGRVALQSLQQSETFYRNNRMTDVGLDHPKLRYFEMTREQASAFLKGGG